MSVEVVTVWYNEAFLAPFFLRHYAWADRISLFYDMDSADDSLAVIRTFANVTVTPFRFTDGFDSLAKQRLINGRYASTECDWVLAVDADEFVFYKPGENDFSYDLRPFLAPLAACDLVRVRLYSVYPVKGDKPLDPALPAVPQRRHGNPEVPKGYVKPALLRAGLPVLWWVGCHDLSIPEGCTIREAPLELLGAHWHKADKNLALTRILRDRVPRVSQKDRQYNFSSHYYTVSERDILDEFAAHEHAPRLF